jgi:hypothetical protein
VSVHAALTARTIDILPLDMRAAVGSVNAEKRTAELIFSTGAAVDRMDWYSGKRYREVLGMKPTNIRLDRLNAGAPLLDSHSAYAMSDILGTVEPGSARIEGGKAIATVRFSKRDSVTPIWNDVMDGIMTAVSVGYRVHKFEETTDANGAVPTRTAVDWEPFEISMVPMPADPGAKVRGGEKALTFPCVIVTQISDADRSRALRLAQARTS